MNGTEQYVPYFRDRGTNPIYGRLDENTAPWEAKFERIGDSLDQLTQRQREILRKVVDGVPNKVIALDLNISQRTVEKHREGIRQKMGVRSVAELVKTMVLYETFVLDVEQRSAA